MIRYPGGKSKLRKQIIIRIAKMFDGEEYVEPFFGGGSVGLNVLKDINVKKIWINDLDLGVASLWTSVIRFPEMLKKVVTEFEPSVELFDKFKDLLQTRPHLKIPEEVVNWGLMKLAIHQISYSGLGVKSGGPLGGRDQKSKYKIDCRWSPSYICKRIDEYHKMFSEVEVRYNCCSSRDFLAVIDGWKDFIFYLDPPYFVKGRDLYQYGFSNNDHFVLADLLKSTTCKWILSYDDCEEIRELYSWAHIEEIEQVSYSITALKNKETGERMSRNKSELLITKG